MTHLGLFTLFLFFLKRNDCLAPLLAITIAFVSCSTANPQLMPERIKSNSSLIWGEGEDAAKAKAKELAETDLLHKIQVSITVTTTGSQEEIGGTEQSVLSERFSLEHHSVSSLYLKNLNYKETQKDGVWNIIAYISKQSLAESFEMRKNKLRTYAEAARTAIDEGRLNDALRSLYWGYLLARTYPDTIDLDLGNGDKSKDPQVVFANYINHVMGSLKIIADDCCIVNQEIIAPLRVTYNDKPVQGLIFSYYDGMHTSFGRVIEGRDRLVLYDKPFVSDRRIPLTVEYAHANEMANDPEIQNLYNCFRSNAFNSLKIVDLHFPWVQDLGLPDSAQQKMPEYAVEKDLIVEDEMEQTAVAIPEPKPEQPAAELRVPEFVKVLYRHCEFVEFMDFVNQYMKLGVLDCGNRSDFGNGEGCFVAIADEENVVEMLYFNGNNYRSVMSGTEYAELSGEFSGKRQVWIKEIEK